MTAKKHKQARRGVVDAAPSPRMPQAGNWDTETPTWRFHRVDRQHAHWGWDQLDCEAVRRLLCEWLPSFEGLTWAQIKQASGRRNQGTNNHSLTVDGFCKAAQDRLDELNLDDQDSLFSLGVNNTWRLYGIREGASLVFVWFDCHHDTAMAAYPMAKHR